MRKVRGAKGMEEFRQITWNCLGSLVGTGTQEFTFSITSHVHFHLRTILYLALSAWLCAWGYIHKKHPPAHPSACSCSFMPCFSSPQRIQRLITPDPSLPQPGRRPPQDGTSALNCSPLPVKRELIAWEKETHL